MHAIALAKTKLLTIRQHLTRFENRPLNKAALTVVVFLDIFVLISIFNGLDAHTRQLLAPDHFIPHACRSIVLDGDWTPTNRTEKLSSVVNAYTNSYVRPDEVKKAVHPVCEPYRDLIDQIKTDSTLKPLFEGYAKSNRELLDLQRRVGNMKGAYDTALLEKMAKQDQEQTDVSQIKDDVHAKAGSLNTLSGQLKTFELRINEDKRVLKLWENMDGLQQAARDTLREALRTALFWFPLKKLGMQLAFLLPLLGILVAWNTASLRKGYNTQILVSSHLVVIACIPIFARLVSTVYDIIPKTLLRHLIQWLEAFNLVAVWYYLGIALAIGASLFVVYFFQKKLFSVEKLIERRIDRGQCMDCGKSLKSGACFCWHCGVSLIKECESCHHTTPTCSNFCVACGSRQQMTTGR
jgi:hypothetical protein